MLCKIIPCKQLDIEWSPSYSYETILKIVSAFIIALFLENWHQPVLKFILSYFSAQSSKIRKKVNLRKSQPQTSKINICWSFLKKAAPPLHIVKPLVQIFVVCLLRQKINTRNRTIVHFHSFYNMLICGVFHGSTWTFADQFSILFFHF